MSSVDNSLLLIGDLHFKLDNLPQVRQLHEQVQTLVTSGTVAGVVVLGDVMHYHERVYTIVQNQVLEFVKMLSIVPVVILVGNHDMINNQVYCDPKGSWLSVFDGWKNVQVISTPKLVTLAGITIAAVPYVYPGKFEQALLDFDVDLNSANLCVAHQEFRGANLGAIVSQHGDEYKWDVPCFSGHVHNCQVLNRVHYTGAAFEHSFGAHKCWLFRVWLGKGVEHCKIASNVQGKRLIQAKLVDGVVDLKMPSTPKSLNKCVISCNNIHEYYRWLTSEQGLEAAKHYILDALVDKVDNVKEASISNGIIAEFVDAVTQLHPEFVDKMSQLIVHQ